VAVQQGTAALSAASVLSASPSVTAGLSSLWAAYQLTAAQHHQLHLYWKLAAAGARTDGTAGYLYSQLYAAEQAMDAAYRAWATLYEQTYQAPPHGPYPGLLPGGLG
jgi:hypothetical protein